MRSVWTLVAAALILPAAQGQQAAPKTDPAYADQVRPFLARHCEECHAGEKPKGDFRLDHLDPAFAAKTAEERWRSVLEQLQAGSMPPKKKARPAEADVRAVQEWIVGRIASVEAARRVAEGRVVMRGLNPL